MHHRLRFRIPQSHSHNSANVSGDCMPKFMHIPWLNVRHIATPQFTGDCCPMNNHDPRSSQAEVLLKLESRASSLAVIPTKLYSISSGLATAESHSQKTTIDASKICTSLNHKNNIQQDCPWCFLLAFQKIWLDGLSTFLKRIPSK